MRISDWSSDVCSSDLPGTGSGRRATLPGEYQPPAVEYEEKGALAESWALLRTLCQSRYRVAIGLLAGGIVAVLVGNMVGQVQLNQWHGAFFDALEQQNLHRSEEHTSELQSLMRNSYAVFCLKK